MAASSLADPVTSTAWSIDEESTKACAALLTMFDASTAAALIPDAFMIAAGAEVAELPTIDVMCAVELAVTLTFPAAVIEPPVIDASVVAGLLPPNAFEISGSPSSASSAAKRMFERFQPIVLKASSMPTTWLVASIALRLVAAIVDVFVDETVRSPPVVVTSAAYTAAAPRRAPARPPRGAAQGVRAKRPPRRKRLAVAGQRRAPGRLGRHVV